MKRLCYYKADAVLSHFIQESRKHKDNGEDCALLIPVLVCTSLICLLNTGDCEYLDTITSPCMSRQRRCLLLFGLSLLLYVRVTCSFNVGSDTAFRPSGLDPCTYI
jgi:hypothetical protein